MYQQEERIISLIVGKNKKGYICVKGKDDKKGYISVIVGNFVYK